MKQRLSLYELNSMVRDALSMTLPDSYWVEAELSEVREGYGGHCYMELIEKEERSNTPIAKAHAACWRNRWISIRPQFEQVTGQRLHAGMKVLLKVQVEDRTGQMDFKIIHINYERNTADVAAYGGVFRTLLSVWNANFHRISYDSSTDWFCN